MNKKYLSMSKDLFLQLDCQVEEKTLKQELENIGINKKNGMYNGFEYELIPFGNAKGAMSQVTALNEVAICALNEHTTNSFEAIVQKYHCEKDYESYRSMMDDTSPQPSNLPQSMSEAMEKYMGINPDYYQKFNKKNSQSSSNGRFNQDTTLHQQSEVLIQHGITSVKGEDTLIFQDFGGGQSPSTIESTMFSSGSDSYKLGCPYMTGRHNMGSKGIINHLGGRKYQLIASKLAPSMAKHSTDPNKDLWCYSLAMVLDEEELVEFGFNQIRNSLLVYLKFKVDGEWVMPMFDGTFEAVKQIELGGASVEKFQNPQYGTYKKFYNVQIGNGIKKISHLTPAGMTGINAMTRLRSAMNFSYPNVVTPVRFFSPPMHKPNSGNTSIMLGLEYELHSKYGNLDVEKWDVGSINFQGHLIPATIYKYNDKSLLDHSGIVWKIYNNYVVESPMAFTHKDFKLQSIQSDIILVLDFNAVPLSLRNKLLTTGRETFRSTDEMSKLREYVGKEVQALEQIRQLIISKRKASIQLDRKSFEKILRNCFSVQKSKSSLGKGDSEGTKCKSNELGGTNLNDVISILKLDDKHFQNVASDDDPETQTKTKIIGSCHDTFKLYFNDDAKESFYNKYGLNVDISFEDLNGNIEKLTDKDLFMVKKGNGYTMCSISQSDAFRGESFLLNIKFSPKNINVCDHPTFKFSIPCLSQYKAKQDSTSPSKSLKPKKAKGTGSDCGLDIHCIYEESEFNDFITSKNDDQLFVMEKTDAYGYQESPTGRVWGLNMLNPHVLKWKKFYSKSYDSETLDGFYSTFCKTQLTPAEVATQKKEKLDKNYSLNLDSLNMIHPHTVEHWDVTWHNVVEKALDKKIK